MVARRSIDQAAGAFDLFSKVLWKEDAKYYLKTPVEQIEIEVEDEPLLVNQVDVIEIDCKSLSN
jgi:hypothetical protein